MRALPLKKGSQAANQMFSTFPITYYTGNNIYQSRHSREACPREGGERESRTVLDSGSSPE